MSRKDLTHRALAEAQRALQEENVYTIGASGFPDDLMFLIEEALAKIEGRDINEDYYFTSEYYKEKYE